MTHQPQQILVRVECKERLPNDDTAVFVENTPPYIGINIYNHNIGEWQLHPNPIYWYEPATRIVLTVEDYDSEMRTAYLDGYNAANGRIS